MKTYRYTVEGRVQGVSFRYYTLREARSLGIRGTVANTDRGSVEIFAQGDEESIRSFEEFLERGPSPAHVTRLDKREFESDEVYAGFEICF